MDMGYSSSPAYVKQSKVKGRPLYHGIKRLFDFLASSIALILLSPLFCGWQSRFMVKTADQSFTHKSELARMKSLSGSTSFGPWWSMLRS